MRLVIGNEVLVQGIWSWSWSWSWTLLHNFFFSFFKFIFLRYNLVFCGGFGNLWTHFDFGG